jgi:hypothetical protein
MDIKISYKVISGSSAEIEKLLNVLSQDRWRPVAMSCFGQPIVLSVILENKVVEEAKLNLPNTIAERASRDGALEEIQ